MTAAWNQFNSPLISNLICLVRPFCQIPFVFFCFAFIIYLIHKSTCTPYLIKNKNKYKLPPDLIIVLFLVLIFEACTYFLKKFFIMISIFHQI